MSADSDNGFGVTVGIGAEFLFTPNWSTVVRYEAHDLRFASSTSDRDRISVGTVGIRYTY